MNEIPIINPIYDVSEDYEKVYGDLDYKNKVILEVGADIGSTASFFLRKGAKQVISIEANPNFFRQLTENAKTMNIVPILLTVKTPNDLIPIIQQYKPDLLHMDCEGCEFSLLDIPDDVLKIIKEFQIETHCFRDKNLALIDKLLRNNFEVNVYTYHKNIDFSIVFPGVGDAWIIKAKHRDVI